MKRYGKGQGQGKSGEEEQEEMFKKVRKKLKQR